MFLPSAFLVFFVFATVSAQDEDFFTSDDKVVCINKMVDWCNNMEYPKNDVDSLSMVSISVSDSSGKFWRLFCASDSDSTNCTRNGSPWFSCNSDHNLVYNGVSLQKNKTDGVDDEICNTTKTAFNDIFVQNFSYKPTNITTNVSHEIEDFFRQLSEMQEVLDMLRDRMNLCFPFCSRNFNLFPYPTGSRGSATLPPTLSPSEQRNQIERERE